MSLPLITWMCIVGMLGIDFIIDGIVKSHKKHQAKRSIVSVGSEREELFIPGDARQPSNQAYEEMQD